MLNNDKPAQLNTDATTATKLSKQEHISSVIREKIPEKELDAFASFCKKQIEEKDIVMQSAKTTAEIISAISLVFSDRVIPAGLSLNFLISQFRAWHAKNGAGSKRLGRDESTADEKEVEEVQAINQTAEEAGGMTLQKIGSLLDGSRTFTPTAINDIINKLTTEEGGKLDVMRKILKHHLGLWVEGDKTALATFSSAMKSAMVQAAGKYVEFLEAARSMDPEGELVLLENLVQVLDAAKLRESMSKKDVLAENMFLERFIHYANDHDYANDDAWKDIVMEMLSIDMLEAPMFSSKENLNIVKSYQNLVSNILKPPPRRGRPKKIKEV